MRKRLTALVISFLLLFALIPTSLFASENTIDVLISINLDGEIEKASDNTYMAYKHLTVSDSDGDGTFTINDALICAHKAYYSGYTDEDSGYDTNENKAIKIWGKSFDDISFMIVQASAPSIISGMSVNTTETVDGVISNGQLLSVRNNSRPAESIFFMDGVIGNFLRFDLTALKNTDLSFVLKCRNGNNPAAVLSDYSNYSLYISKDNGEFTKLENVTFASNGKITVNFSESGDYILTAVSSETTDYIDNPICKIHVIDSSPLITDLHLYSDSSATTELIEFDADTYSYSFTIPDSITTLYFKASIDGTYDSEVRATLYSSANDGQWDSANTATSAGDLSSVTVGTYHKINVTDLQGKFVYSNGLTPDYNIEITKKATLKSLTVNGTSVPDFQPDKEDCSFTVDDETDTLSIVPTAKLKRGVNVEINGETKASGQTFTVEVGSLDFVNGKAVIEIKTIYNKDLYTGDLYKLTIIAPVSEDAPTFSKQPVGAEYIVGADAAPLEVNASASGPVTYQWYVNDSNSYQNATEIEGAINKTYTPSTDEVGSFYYFCKASNEEAGQATYSDIALIKVVPDPTPTLVLDSTLATLTDEQAALIKEAFNSFEGNSGFYYRAKDTNASPIQFSATSDAEGGGLSYRWVIRNGSGSTMKTTSDGTYTPDVSSPIGAVEVMCTAIYSYNGKTYTSDTITVYYYVDDPEYSYPTDEVLWDGSGTEEDPWLLKSQEDLERLRDYVAQGYDFKNTFFEFANDITLDTSWAGIGEADADDGQGTNIRPFSGTMDGKDFTLTYESGATMPLFSYVREAAVKNLNIYAPYIANYGLVANRVVDYGYDGNYNIGTGGSYAAGCPDVIEIDNVTIKSGSIIMRSGFIGGSASGGNIVTIKNCTAEENVKIGCLADGTSAGNSIVGTFAGSLCGSITNCTSAADVYGTDTVGGIVARKDQSMGPFVVDGNEFTGTVTASGNYAGGIVAAGYIAESAPNSPCVSITNCNVSGDITGASYVGGIFGGEGGIIQAWGASSIDAGVIQNNNFTGTVTATDEDGYVGGIIGYMKSLNVNNRIENNYYAHDCGAEKGIGYVWLVDTSGVEAEEPYEIIDGTVYINTEGRSFAWLHDLDTALGLNLNDDGTLNPYTYVAKPSHNRTDDPLGADAEKLCYTDKITDIEVTETPTKTEYILGEELDLAGLVVSANWYPEATTEIDPEDLVIEGFDSSTEGEQTITVTYGDFTTTFKVTVTHVEYEFLEGANGTWTADSDEGLKFRVDMPFAKFTTVDVDGETLDSSKYEASEGSTVIVLDKDYLNGLTAGSHTIRVNADDGYAETSFTIKPAGGSAATGEDIDPGLWIMMTVAVAIGVASIPVTRRRRRSRA